MEKLIAEKIDKEKKKTEYFSQFALKHLSAMRILEKGGVLGEDNKEWRNVAEHCLVAAVGADILAEHLNADRDTVVLATFLHDWYKRREVEAIREHGGEKGVTKTVQEDDRLLREYGFSEEFIRVAHANMPVSADPEYIAGRSRNEKIVHFMDHITLGSEYVEVKDRWRELEKEPFFKAYSESYRGIYGGKNLKEFQKELAESEEEEFEHKIELSPGTIVEFIRTELEKRINAKEDR